MIQRDKYIEKITKFRDLDLIKVLTGMRRSGKSTLFSLYIDSLKASGVNENRIVKINLDDPEYDSISYKELYDVVKSRAQSNEKTYVFLDEVQNVPEFEKAIDGLYLDKNIDLYITGSNAYMLSGELTTLLSGRYVEIKVLPLSFSEYASAFPGEDKHELLLGYMRTGGMPATVDIIKRDGDLETYFDGVFSTVVYKDIMLRNNLKGNDTLREVLQFVYDNVGNPLSAKKISDTLTSRGMKISNHTVENYLGMFSESFLTYRAEQFDVKGRNILARNYKYYAVDPGLRGYLLGQRADNDLGRILENVVYLELLRRGYQVYVGKLDDLEIDFVAKNRKGLEYFQVALSTWDENTLARELRPFLKPTDAYPRVLLTLDRDLGGDYNGIKKLNVADWLLT